MLGNQGQARKNLELALQINPELALARRLLGEAPTPPAEREAVAQTPSRPSKHVSGAAIAKGNAWPKQWSAKPAVTAPIVPLPSHTIKQSAAPEPDHPLDHPTSLPEPTLPYSLPPALRKFLQESTPNPLESGRSVLIDARVEPSHWADDEVDVTTDSGNVLLIPVVLADLEAVLANDRPKSVRRAVVSRPNLLTNLLINPAYFLEEPTEPAGPPEVQGNSIA